MKKQQNKNIWAVGSEVFWEPPHLYDKCFKDQIVFFICITVSIIILNFNVIFLINFIDNFFFLFFFVIVYHQRGLDVFNISSILWGCLSRGGWRSLIALEETDWYSIEFCRILYTWFLESSRNAIHKFQSKQAQSSVSILQVELLWILHK